MSQPDSPPPTGSHESVAGGDIEQELREMNAALLRSLVRQQELSEQAEQAMLKLHNEERLRQRQLTMTNASRVSTVGELATGLAHELNQPLAAISNLAEACSAYLRAGSLDTDKLLRLLSDIAEQSMRATGIVSHLRSFVDKGVPQLEVVALRELVGPIPHLLVQELERNQVTLHIKLPARPLRFLADPIQIEQVLINLIQNSIDSIQEAGGSQHLIELSARSVNKMCEVRVRDTGVGISGSAGERMFEPFFTTKSKGLGMGLSLSRSILEAHRGRIWMETPSDGKPGIVVLFTIPLIEPERPRKSRAQPG